MILRRSRKIRRRFLYIGIVVVLLISVNLLIIVSEMDDITRLPAILQAYYKALTLEIMASRLWPSGTDDRIIRQLDFEIETNNKTINIYAFDRVDMIGVDVFKNDMCKVQDCAVTDADKAHVVILEMGASLPDSYSENASVIGLFMLESPTADTTVPELPGWINWTLTYRPDSTVVTPYEKFVLFPNFSQSTLPLFPARNYARGKTRMVAAFVSNCGASNNRLEYISELQKNIDVHVYGNCGNYTCSRSAAAECFQMLRDHYKFYLAFENSNCIGYITEKFFLNALQNDVIPVVMGARREDYRRVAPAINSYIHVDDFSSPAALAEYLHQLASDDVAYSAYFRWHGTGEFINTKYWCRVCAMAHASRVYKAESFSYAEVLNWWQGDGVCVYPDVLPWSTWRHNETATDRTSQI